MTPSAATADGWPGLGVVVPVFNEAQGIDAACRSIVAAARTYEGRAAVIAVDDGSRDSSVEILERLGTELYELDLVRHPRNLGYGEALRTGARRARELGLEYVVFIDSDLTNPPSDLLRIGALAREGHPYIKASRFIGGGEMAAVPLRRRVISTVGNIAARILFGTTVRDITNGFRAGRTDLICSWPTRERGFAVIVEEFACALRDGITPKEFPTSLLARQAIQRRSAFTYSPTLLWSYLRYPLRFGTHRLSARLRN